MVRDLTSSSSLQPATYPTRKTLRMPEVGLIPGLPDDISIECLTKVPHRFHSKLREVCRNWRSLISSSSSYYRRRRLSNTSEPRIFLIHSHVVYIWGCTDPYKDTSDRRFSQGATLYNPIADTCHRHPSLTTHSSALCVAVGGNLILLGGYDTTNIEPVASSDVQIVDMATGQCRRGKPMSIARTLFAYAVVGSLVYIAGGQDNKNNALNSAELYDPAADEWRPLPTMSEERYKCRGVGIGGKFMVVSQCTSDSQVQGRIRCGESYNPATLKWAKEEDELWGREGDLPCVETNSLTSAIFALPSPEGERLWHLDCSGGKGRCIKEYDGSAKTWRVVADVPEGLDSGPSVAVVGGDKVFVVGNGGGFNRRAWMMKDTRMKREWEEIFIPFGFEPLYYSPVAFSI